MREKKALAMVLIMIIGSFMIAGRVMGEDDDEHEGHQVFRRKLDVAPVTDPVYRKECGSCHFAYQPGLLPARSWTKIMGSLDNHFADNAELGVEDQKAITAYLVKNAADGSGYKVSKKILGSVSSGDPVMAISKTPYFTHKHREIPVRMVKNNPQVRSFAHCARCHANAEKGSYNEHDVAIPGFGKFED